MRCPLRRMWWLFLLPGCAPWATSWEDEEEFPVLTADSAKPPAEDPDVLRVLTWNIKFGGGRVDFFWDGWDDRAAMTEAETLANLEALVALIDEVNPDVLLAQEVDVSSKRSAYVDEVDWLLNHWDFNYAAFVPNWESQFVASGGLGRVEAGQAVFSKYPLDGNLRIDLPQSEDESAIVNYFYLHRAIQVTEVTVGDTAITLVNNHPDAYSSDGTKKKHIEKIDEVSTAIEGPRIIGGDFNVIPRGSLQTSGFEDVPSDLEGPGIAEVTYSPEDLTLMDPFYEKWDSAIDIADYEAAETPEEQARFHTHSISQDVFWTQALDYLFSDLAFTEGHILQLPGDGDIPIASVPMDLSDHCPVLGIVELK